MTFGVQDYMSGEIVVVAKNQSVPVVKEPVNGESLIFESANDACLQKRFQLAEIS